MSSQGRDVAGQPEDRSAQDTGRIDGQGGRQRVDQDRLRDLLNALGDPNHPLHSHAVNELVDIGSPAVGALSTALGPNYPWLTSYRAAEALAQIGDGRASGALIAALRHPNSNVRWSVVRALSEIGDTRSLLALRRVVHDDHGKTSWGESVSDTAQLALDRLQSRSAVLRFSEPIKTALVFVVMLAVLAFASNRVQALRSELTRSDTPTPVIGSVPDVEDTTTADNELALTTEAETPGPEVTVTGTPQVVGRVVVASGNVRSGPGVDYGRVGIVYEGDELIFLAESNGWYRVRLGQDVRSDSRIDGGEGYVSEVIVDVPDASFPPDATTTP